MSKIYLGGGCFWCIEAVFSRTIGVVSAISGYMGGARANPTYEQICTGVTGHAEVVEVVFDDEQIDLEEILEIFWAIHDPTSLNQQGADKGTQYRSAIFYTSLEQLEIIEKSIEDISSFYDKPIVTEVKSAPPFYKAEEYHQDYYSNNPNQGYCYAVVRPKVEKFMKNFKSLVR